MLIDQISDLRKKEKVEDNLFVKNIIVNKDKIKKEVLPFIATERWIDQLGNRLQINSQNYLNGMTFFGMSFCEYILSNSSFNTNFSIKDPNCLKSF